MASLSKPVVYSRKAMFTKKIHIPAPQNPGSPYMLRKTGISPGFRAVLGGFTWFYRFSSVYLGYGLVCLGIAVLLLIYMDLTLSQPFG